MDGKTAMKTMNRREFFALSAKGALAAWAWAGAGPLWARTDKTGAVVGVPPSAVVDLPAHGTAFVVNDFHASWNDYEAFKKTSRVFERMQNNEDVYLVINGDIVDSKPSHSQPDGDARILDDLMEQRERLRTAGAPQRLVLLLGNHEQQGAAIYESLFSGKDLVLARPGRDKVVRREILLMALENEKANWSTLSPIQKQISFWAQIVQFDFARRMKPEHLAFIREFSLMARAANGVVIMHGSYPRPGSSNPAYDLLWERDGTGDDFLAAAKGELIVNGHTAPSLFGSRYPGAYDPDRGMGIVDKDRVIIAPSYGGGGTYLALDLSRTYLTDKDLVAGREVARLRPA